MSARGETEHLNLPDDAILEAFRQTIMGSVLNDLHTEISKAVSGRPYVERIELYKNFSSFCALTMMHEQR